MLFDAVRRAFFLEQWQVGWSRTKIGDFLKAPSKAEFTWYSPKGKFQTLADPFGIETESGLDVYAERLVHGHPRGRIVQLSAARPATTLSTLAKPWHLSYPFIVFDHDRRFVVPEQQAAGCLAFYPLDDSGAMQGEPVAKLEGMPVLDATFLYHDGHWWLFAASPDIDCGPGGLLLYYSKSLTGPYASHPENPIVTDRSRARPAGRIISFEGRLFRPGQDSTVRYGDAINISEITEISTTAYSESPAMHIAPGDLKGAFPYGSHHLDHTANYVLVDSKRLVFCWYAWWLKLLSLMRQG
jgi:hypothetical protein